MKTNISYTFPFFLVLCILLFTPPLFGVADLLKGPYGVYGGPEVYHINRIREGGTEQKGLLAGGRFGIERLAANSIYYNLDAYAATGVLRGHTNKEPDLTSRLYDYQVEGKLGFMLCQQSGCFINFTPYAGYGHFWSTNEFRTPLDITFNTDFEYIAGGFISRFYLFPNCSIGLDFKAKFMLEGKNKIEDSEMDNPVQLIGEETQYEVDVPLSYACIYNQKIIVSSIVPFYRKRHYGGKEDVFDFFDTQFRIYGMRFRLEILF